MRKITTITFLIAISVFFNNCLFAQQKNTECKKLKKEIKSLISECQSCETDGECFVDESLIIGCPFGCDFIRSHKFDNSKYLTSIKIEIEKYSDVCEKCLWDCDVTPKKQEVGCRQGKCVDLRYYSGKNLD
ncbi:MAG: hypothetical protein PHU64_02665 [Candidatus Omnitrophica bacterium]|nr:hypothetical protein [Candidatus Omnitrophota bacterium]MDD5430492.1 hypothetical protein [Candidatus Omnitrophota bacterium]